jgi:hypothetical protein
MPTRQAARRWHQHAPYALDLRSVLASTSNREKVMSKAQQVFEAVMRGKGHDDFSKSPTGKYLNPGLQVRWPMFLLGWEMSGAMS